MLRPDLFANIFFIGLANSMIRPILKNINDIGFIESITTGFGISFIIWFSIFSSLFLIQNSNEKKATRNDFLFSFIALVLFMIPSSYISWITLSVYSLYTIFATRLDSYKLRNACLIMLAVSARTPLSDICLKIFSDSLLKFDAIVTHFSSKMFNPSITRHGNILVTDSNHELLIMTGCASFTNISLAILLWFTIIRSNVFKWQKHYNLYILPLCLSVMGLNIFRLSMMSFSKDLYFYYHDGLGANIINACILIVSILFAFICIHTPSKKRGIYV